MGTCKYICYHKRLWLLINCCSYVIFTRWFCSGTRNLAAVGMTIMVWMHKHQVETRYFKNGWRLLRYTDTICIILMCFSYNTDSACSSQALCYETMAILLQDANFMPGNQPWGTYSFNPSSSSAQSMLDNVNAEEDGAASQAPLFHLISTFWGLEQYHLRHWCPISCPLVVLGHCHLPLSSQWPILTQLSHMTYLWAQVGVFSHQLQSWKHKTPKTEAQWTIGGWHTPSQHQMII